MNVTWKIDKLVRALLAVLTLALSSAAPVVALAASVPASGVPINEHGAQEGCVEPRVEEGAPLDVVIKAKLLGALCRQNSVLAVALAFIAGLLTSLSPCVYPLIPITISIFGARQASTKLAAFSLSAFYVLGMSVLYTGLGVLFASLGLVSGSLMAVPWVVMGIGLLCLAMAASMFGAFEISLPAELQGRLSTVGGAGYRGAFLMGLAAGVIAAPCTGPVLAVILSLIGKSGQPTMGITLMASYSLGMGLLFLVLGTFSSALSRIPRSGRWMESVKAVLGLAMIAVAFYLVKPHLGVLQSMAEILGGLPGAAIWAVVLMAAGMAAGALHLSFKDEGKVPKVRKALGLTLASLGLFTLVGWAESGPAAPTGSASMAWVDNHDTALKQAREAGKPVIIDFGAEWCAACKELEKFTFTDPQVAEESRRFINAKIDSTELTDEMTALWKRYGITGLPAVIFIDSRGKVLVDPRVDGFLPPRDFLREMRKVR